MEIITVTKDNLESEHICCAISNNKDVQVMPKKAWLAERFDDGLVFKKGNIRGKCFIEYIPAEKAWTPIDAEGYMFIDCLWVAGQYKGQGNGDLLLDECIRDSREKGKKGIAVLSSKKKMPFLSDPGYMRHRGFLLADTAEPCYELLYLPFDSAEIKPRFKAHVKESATDEKGFVLYYSHQCPYTAKYVPIVGKVAEEESAKFKSVRFDTAEQAQSAPAPFTTYSLFYDGKFVTNEILSDKKFRKMIEDLR